MSGTSRFSTQATIAQLPGCCLICKNTKGPVINPGVRINGYGFVFICQTCVRQMAEVILPEPEPVVITQGISEEEFSARVSDAADRVVSAISALADEFRSASVLEDDEDSEGADGNADGDSERSDDIAGQDGDSVSEPEPVGVSGDSDVNEFRLSF